jgi:hypothetical protein
MNSRILKWRKLPIFSMHDHLVVAIIMARVPMMDADLTILIKDGKTVEQWHGSGATQRRIAMKGGGLLI